MLENTILFMTILLFVILTAGFVWYMRGRVDNRDYVFYKIGLLFRYVILKLEVGAGYGIIALESLKKNKQKEEGTRYPSVNMKEKRLRMKERKLKEIEEEHFSSKQQGMKAARHI